MTATVVFLFSSATFDFCRCGLEVTYLEAAEDRRGSRIFSFNLRFYSASCSLERAFLSRFFCGYACTFFLSADFCFDYDFYTTLFCKICFFVVFDVIFSFSFIIFISLLLRVVIFVVLPRVNSVANAGLSLLRRYYEALSFEFLSIGLGKKPRYD